MVYAEREELFRAHRQPAILAALHEAKGVPPAPAQEKMKKSELADVAECELAGTFWLPSLLRNAA